MGYIRHHAIICTSYTRDILEPVHEFAANLFGKNVTEIVDSHVNGYCSFFVAPDGSKLGWTESNKGNDQREELIDYINSIANEDGSDIQYCELFYGDDEGEAGILRHN